MDGRKNNSGKKGNKGGRKPKADEIAMIDRMDAILAPNEAWFALAAKVREGDSQCIKTWLEYRYGKPKQTMDVTTGGDKITAPIQWVKGDE